MEDEEGNSTTITTASTTMSTNFFSLLLVLFLCFTSNFSLLLADDSGTMLTLSRALNGPAGWVGSDPCKWQGVSCDTSGSVTSISLISKSISGQLPPEVNNLSNLKYLSLQQNLIHGSIPPISNLKNLQQVYLNGNRFTSIPSPFFSDLPSLQTLSLSDNPLSPWTIPGSLSELTSLQSFMASNASIFGTIPDIFASLPSMKELRLSYNNLTGTLPPSLSGSSIQNLWINNQKVGLSGSLYVLGEMPSLAQVWVHDNAFSGAIPDLSKCTQLFDLQLRENQLTGVVPLSLTNLAGLRNVSLQNNALQGPVPAFKTGVQVNLGTTNNFCLPKPGPCDPQVTVLLEIAEAFGYPREFAESWKGNNACIGWSHVSCDARGNNVTVLNFAKQGLIGTISPAFVNLTSLTTIILSDNNLYGKIPDSLTSLEQLQRIDVSNNNLTGKVPDFPGSVKVQTDGNRFLGTNLDTTPRSSSSRSSSSGTSRSMTSTWVITGIIVLSLVVVVVLASIIYCIYLRKRRNDHGLEKGFGKLKGKSQDMKVKQKNEQKGAISKPENSTHSIQFYDGGSSVFPIELIREVTDNFSSDNILGRGGFGIVYKGILRDGTQIAVKRMESNAFGTKGISEFEAEIAVLSKVRHRHLVAFLGYCFNGYERIVVYEYMPQGTLGQHLFEWKEMGSSPLTWKQRLAIALDVARGVEYLHSLAQQSFIHRDLKPSNILLADDMRAKVSDFGLVKNAPEGKASVETRLAGTFGYLAPEYAATGRVTTKVDVFAYGVVLMEMITGRKALDESLPEGEAQLVTWFRRVLINKDSIRKSIDPSLQPDEEMYKSICKVAELAGHCTAREPTQRPDMSHAVSMLSPLVNEWRPTRSEEEEEEDGNINDIHVSLPQALQRWQHGETTAVSDFSQSQNYLSSAPTTPSGIDDNFDLQGR